MVNTQLIPVYSNGSLVGIETDKGVMEGEELRKFLEKNPLVGGFSIQVPTVESKFPFGEQDHSE